MRFSHAFATLFFVAVFLLGSALATEIRYDFEVLEFRESMSLYAPFERLTGFYRADVDYSTAELNSFLGGQVQLHDAGPLITDVQSFRNFGTYEFYGTPGGSVLDWQGDVDDFNTGFDIAAGVLNPRFRQAGTTYTIAPVNGIWTHDVQNGRSSIRVTTPDDETVSVGTPTTRYEQVRQLSLGERSWVDFKSSQTVVIDNDLSTNGGGIRSDTGFQYGGEQRRLAVFGWWSVSELRANTGPILEQAASDQQQGQNILTQINAELQKSQAQRWQIHSELSSRIHAITAQVAFNRAKIADQAFNLFATYLSSSTIDGDMDFLGHFVVGGDPATEGFDSTTVLGNFTTQPLSTFDFDVGVSGYDQMVVEGSVHLGELNQLYLHLADDGLGRYVPEYADAFDLIVADAITTDGVLPVVDEYMPGDLMWLLGVVDLPNGQQALRAVVGVSRIPEPTSLLILTSFVAIGLLWHRQQSSARSRRLE